MEQGIVIDRHEDQSYNYNCVLTALVHVSLLSTINIVTNMTLSLSGNEECHKVDKRIRHRSTGFQ